MSWFFFGLSFKVFHNLTFLHLVYFIFICVYWFNQCVKKIEHKCERVLHFIAYINNMYKMYFSISWDDGCNERFTYVNTIERQEDQTGYLHNYTALI